MQTTWMDKHMEINAAYRKEFPTLRDQALGAFRGVRDSILRFVKSPGMRTALNVPDQLLGMLCVTVLAPVLARSGYMAGYVAGWTSVRTRWLAARIRFARIVYPGAYRAWWKARPTHDSILAQVLEAQRQAKALWATHPELHDNYPEPVFLEWLGLDDVRPVGLN